MNKNIKIAKELLKIAKSLVADFQRIWTFRIEGKIESEMKDNKYGKSIFLYSSSCGGDCGKIQIKMPGNIEVYKTNTGKKDFLNNYLSQNKEIIEQELLKDYIKHWDKDLFKQNGFVEDFFKYPIKITKMEVIEQPESPMFYVNIAFIREYKELTETGNIKLIPDADTETAINSMFANNGF